MKERKIADPSCYHDNPSLDEKDIEPADPCDTLRWRENGWFSKCLDCGGSVIVVDDTGTFGWDGETYK
jgi:hypothetical protein